MQVEKEKLKEEKTMVYFPIFTCLCGQKLCLETLPNKICPRCGLDWKKF